MRGCDRRQQVGRERSNAAFARQVVADKRDLANSRSFFHEAFLSFLALVFLRRPRAPYTDRCPVRFRTVANTVTGSHRAGSRHAWPQNAIPDTETLILWELARA